MIRIMTNADDDVDDDASYWNAIMSLIRQMLQVTNANCMKLGVILLSVKVNTQTNSDEEQNDCCLTNSASLISHGKKTIARAEYTAN